MDLSTQIALRLDRVQLLSHSARRKRLWQIGLWRGQMPILDYVLANEGCTQAALATALGLTPATVAVSTKRLMRAGLLCKEPDPANLRRNRLSITPLGREKVRLGSECARLQNERVFAALNDEEKRQMIALLDTLIDALGAPAGEIRPLENYILKNQLEKEVQDECCENS